MGGDLGELWDGPQKNLRWRRAHASVPPIFGEVVLRGAGKKYEVTKKGKKGDMWYIADLRQAKNPKRRLTTKKVIRNFRR